MECDVCGRAATSRTRLNCPTCARNRLYVPRSEHVVILLDKEAMGRRVEGAAQGLSSKLSRESLSRSGKIIDTHDCAKSSELDIILSETSSLQERVSIMADRALALRSQMEEYKSSMKTQRTIVQQRRSDGESATYGLAEREAKEFESIEASIRRTKRRWEMKHKEIVDGRAALCKPAARLAGLRRHRRPRQDGAIREYYTIGSGIPVFDLRELHTAKHDDLSASLTHVAYLTTRAANYLALRLPAEITLPHKDYPLPTIFLPQSSYQAREVPFPGTTPATSSSNSPVTSRTFDTRPLPTPRPLFLRGPLSKLAKDDHKQYSYFVEGVTLLAWNIAWLCKTQGMSGFDTEWDICAVGRNLWNLLLAEKSNLSTVMAQASVRGAGARQPPPENYPARFGHLSHGTAHSFFNSTDGKNIMRDWRLRLPMSSVGKIKEFLNNEMQKAEWELLQENEWDVEAAEEEAVLVGGKRFDTEQAPSAKDASAKPTTSQAESEPKGSVRSAGRPSRNDNDDAAKGPKESGTSGWMKLRTRSPEPKS